MHCAQHFRNKPKESITVVIPSTILGKFLNSRWLIEYDLNVIHATKGNFFTVHCEVYADESLEPNNGNYNLNTVLLFLSHDIKMDLIIYIHIIYITDLSSL